MKFYILELFLNSGEDFSLKLFFQNFFLNEIYFEKLHPLTEKVPKCKISFFPQILKLNLLFEKYLLPENDQSSPRNEKEN